ncbi:hypothetical protein BGW37DRAFT_504827 [Umbelopsis sp. PMI_123]|nr:hypothetical protein BGW37DRAFT_504827 [Umbelopsis sp. PMI_123]
MRPFTILASFNQLRHFLRTKVTELVQPPPKISTIPPSPFVVVNNVRASIAHLQQQQKQQQILFHLTAEQERVQLLNFLQKQFPVVKVMAARSTVRPTTMFPAPRGGQQFQFRTIVSSGTSAISQTGNNAGVGFSRSAVVGYSRTPFARNFSTGKPQSIFQATNAASGGSQTSVLSQVPSRTFTATSKLNQNNTSSPSSPAIGSNLSDKEENVNDANPNCYNGMFGKSRGIFEAVDPSDDAEYGEYPAGLVRRTSVASRRSGLTTPSSQEQTKTNVQFEFMRSDDLSEIHLGGSKRQGRAPKKPPEKQTIQLGEDDAPRICMSFILDGAALWDSDMISTSSSSGSNSGYLDAPFIRSVESAAELYQTHMTNVITILRRLSRHGHFKVLVVGSEVRVLFPDSIFKSFKPSEVDEPLRRKQYARRWLRTIGIDPDSPHFVVENYYDNSPHHSTPSLPIYSEPDVDDSLPDDLVVLSTDFSNMMPKLQGRRRSAPTKKTSSAFDSNIYSNPTQASTSHRISSMRASSLPERSSGLGPEYFKGIQEFLDHVDDLIETSDAFGKKGSNDIGRSSGL